MTADAATDRVAQAHHERSDRPRARPDSERQLALASSNDMSATIALEAQHVPQRTQQSAPARRGELALALQEAFTVAVRLRTNRQVAANAQSFRAHVKQLLDGAHRHAAHAGYNPELIRLAIYAYIAFLDESVLNSGQAMFAEWPRQPLQEEVFG